jgi:hypothetical protein
MPIEPTPAQPMTVRLLIIKRKSPIKVCPVGDSAYQVGTIAASNHADVIVLSAAGLTSRHARTDTGSRRGAISSRRQHLSIWLAIE